MSALIGLLGAVCGVGVWLAIRGVRGRFSDADTAADADVGAEESAAVSVAPPRRRPIRLSTDVAVRLAIGCALGLAVGLVTHWPVVGLYALLAGLWLPSIGRIWELGRREIPRTEAVAALVELIRDLIGTGMSMPDAIGRAARVAPPAIRREVMGLVADLEYEVPPRRALRAFADRLDNAVGDLVAGGLALAMESQAADVTPVLSALAATSREEASRLRQVDAGRVSKRITAPALTCFAIVLVLGILVVDRSAFRAYDGVTGQLVLAIVGAVFVLAFWLMARFAGADRAPRLYAPPDAAGTFR